MTSLRSTLRWALALSVFFAVPACVGTPLPDPPSFAGALVSWSTTPQLDALRLVGRVGAVSPGGVTLRITDPPTAGVLVATNADGSFGRILPATAGDLIYVEQILAGEDRFVGAYTIGTGGVLLPASAGADTDADGTPDAIDCAPGDAAMAGQRCAPVCRTDADCATGQVCVSGACSASAGCVAETCNGLDDDCNGIVDDGDPGGGVACMPTGPGCGVVVCSGAPTCMPVVGTDHETCGNGIDDDCNGLVDDGCP